MKWSYDERLNEWVVILDDIVIHTCKSEQEAKLFIEKEKLKFGFYQRLH